MVDWSAMAAGQPQRISALWLRPKVGDPVAGATSSPARGLLVRLPAGCWLTPADAADAAAGQGAAVARCGDSYLVDGVPLASAIRHGRRSGRVVTRSDGAFLRKW
ncbi:hypothetical protein ACPC54_30630 [Kitasatospora sp. NPDC094028]